MAKTGTVDFTHFRFREDSGSETAAAWIAAEDVDISFGSPPYKFRLRLTLEETAGTNITLTTSLVLQFNHPDVGWNDVAATGNYIKYQGSHGDLTDNEDTTQQLTDPPGSFVTGEVQLDNTIDSLVLTANDHTEVEYALQAGINIDPGDVVDFRIRLIGSGSHFNSIEPHLTRSVAGIAHLIHRGGLAGNYGGLVGAGGGLVR